MVRDQIAARGVRDERVLDAMRSVPREQFVDAGMAEFAYDDSPLPIAEAQTISQPYIVAAMLEAAEVGPADRLLEVGAGSGYSAAVASRIVAQVHAIERHDALSRLARERLEALGCANVEVHTGDGSLGWPEAAPFDAILVAASGPVVPTALKAQLAIGGRLVMPVGETGRQRLVKVTRTGDDTYDQQTLIEVAFVPLIGAQGWAGDGVPACAVARRQGHGQGGTGPQDRAEQAAPQEGAPVVAAERRLRRRRRGP